LSQISAINNQEQAIVTAENNMNSAQAQLNLKSAPATEYDIKMAEAQLKQAQASLALIDAQMTKNIIRAPINGVVSTVDIKRGEIASTGKPAISILGDSSYEITVNIPEVDVAKIKVGNLAQVYLDAFGQDIIWDAQVTDIYPGEKIIEGVPTYETKLKFAANDDRIKPGLTANLDIINEVRDDVLQIPTRAIYQKDGKKFVKVVAQNDDDLSLLRFASLAVATENKKITVYEVPINTGLKGSNGKTQIISGLETGDQILVQ
jgi:RND family efflux transporter MFP subunit